MPRFDLYSKRMADEARGGITEVYNYDILPSTLRVQVLNIANNEFGADRHYIRSVGHRDNSYWEWINTTYFHEKGHDRFTNDVPNAIRSLFTNANFENARDLLELIAYRVWDIEEARGRGSVGVDGGPVSEINYRLRQAGVGYQVEAGRLVRVDSQLIHAEVVKPALTLLSVPGFEGAQEEFLKAHAFYREGNNREAVSMAANAVESTFKGIFAKKGWSYTDGRISGLVKAAKANRLWPDYLDNSFDQLVATLQSGLPKIRDNDASHGQGAEPKEVPGYVAAFALHLAASNIVFIVSAM